GAGDVEGPVVEVRGQRGVGDDDVAGELGVVEHLGEVVDGVDGARAVAVVGEGQRVGDLLPGDDGGAARGAGGLGRADPRQRGHGAGDTGALGGRPLAARDEEVRRDVVPALVLRLDGHRVVDGDDLARGELTGDGEGAAGDVGDGEGRVGGDGCRGEVGVVEDVGEVVGLVDRHGAAALVREGQGVAQDGAVLDRGGVGDDALRGGESADRREGAVG